MKAPIIDYRSPGLGPAQRTSVATRMGTASILTSGLMVLFTGIAAVLGHSSADTIMDMPTFAIPSTGMLLGLIGLIADSRCNRCRTGLILNLFVAGAVLAIGCMLFAAVPTGF
jgi:hypothetical protein